MFYIFYVLKLGDHIFYDMSFITCLYLRLLCNITTLHNVQYGIVQYGVVFCRNLLYHHKLLISVNTLSHFYGLSLGSLCFLFISMLNTTITVLLFCTFLNLFAVACFMTILTEYLLLNVRYIYVMRVIFVSFL